MKSPDEIKKWLKCWAITYTDECPGNCENCEYNTTMYPIVKMSAVVLEYISQLEQRLAHVERERDAAVHDLEELTTRVSSWHLDCDYCKDKDKPICNNCKWEWRGVCEENSK